MRISQLPCVFYVHAYNIRIHFGFYEYALILQSNISEVQARFKSMAISCTWVLFFNIIWFIFVSCLRDGLQTSSSSVLLLTGYANKNST